MCQATTLVVAQWESVGIFPGVWLCSAFSSDLTAPASFFLPLQSTRPRPRRWLLVVVMLVKPVKGEHPGFVLFL